MLVPRVTVLGMFVLNCLTLHKPLETSLPYYVYLMCTKTEAGKLDNMWRIMSLVTEL